MSYGLAVSVGLNTFVKPIRLIFRNIESIVNIIYVELFTVATRVVPWNTV